MISSPGRPRRVLAVVDCLEAGGAQQHLLALSRGMGPLGYELSVATSGRGHLTDAFVQCGIPVITLTRRSTKHRFSPIFVAHLLKVALREPFDLMHAHLYSSAVASATAARVTGLPLILTHHSMNTWQRGWHRRLTHWADHQAQAIIAVSSNVADSLELGGPQVQIIPNGVDLPTRPWSEFQVMEARHKLGLPHDAYVVGFVGRLTSDKNPLLFLEVAASLAARCPCAHFLLVGNGPLYSAVRARARALNLDGRLICTGFRSDAPLLHQAVDVLVLTSESEACPLVVLEAMAASRPIVATKVGDVPHQIVDGVTGFVVPRGDTSKIVAALVMLVDRSLRERLGKAGRDRVQQHFSLSRMLEQTAGVYRNVLEQLRDEAPLREPSCAVHLR